MEIYNTVVRYDNPIDETINQINIEELVDNVIEKTSEKKNVFNLAFYEGLQDLKSHKTHEERWPDKYKEGLKRGKQRIEYLDKIRGTDIKKILSKNKKVLEWWNDI